MKIFICTNFNIPTPYVPCFQVVRIAATDSREQSQARAGLMQVVKL